MTRPYGAYTSSPSRKMHLACACVWIALVALMQSTEAQDQHYGMTHYTTKNGLSNNLVMCIMQDSKGFMWFGTRDGLNKFDGYTFTQFKYQPFARNRLPNNTIRAIVEDKDGMIWIGTGGGGLCRYDRFKNEFITFQYDPNNPQSLCHDYVSSLYLDEGGGLWIGTLGGGMSVLNVTRFNRAQKARAVIPGAHCSTFTNFRHDPSNVNSLGSDFVSAITKDGKGNVFVSTNTVIDRYSPRTKHWKHYYALDSSTGFVAVEDPNVVSVANRDYSLRTDGDGKIYALFYGVNSIYDEHTETFRRTHLPRDRIICSDGSSNFWMGQYDLRVVPLAKRDRSLPGENVLPPILHSEYFYCGYVDSHGSVWIGSMEGVYQFTESARGFTRIQLLDKPYGHKPCNVRCFQQDNTGSIWLGTVYDGIKQLDEKTGAIVPGVNGPTPAQPWWGERVVNAIHQNADGEFFVATRVGVYSSPPRSRYVTRIGHSIADSADILYGNIFCILEDHHGRMWFGGTKGNTAALCIYDPSTCTLFVTGHTLQAIQQQGGTGVWCMFEDSKRRIWIGTTNGVFLVEEPSERITHYAYQKDDVRSLSHDETWTIFEDHSGNIWIGTLGGGLNLRDERTGQFSHFTERNGLAGNNVYGILEDDSGNLWISTNRGLSRFNPTSGSFRTFMNPEIESVGTFNSNASLKTNGGDFLFGGTRGVLSFRPDRIPEATLFAPVFITSFEVLGRKVRAEVNSGEVIHIPDNEDNLSLEFTSLDFRCISMVRYAYMLEGVDPTWIESGMRRNCSYANLVPGSYQFRVKATNDDGVWCDSLFSVTIVVVPPYYRSMWFVSLVMFLALSSASGGIWWRYHLLRVRGENERRMLESELKALRLQINPHFFFNSLNAIQGFAMSNSEKEANRYISKFAGLMRAILESSRSTSVAIGKEIEALTLYLELEALRFKNRFAFRIDIEPSVDTTQHIPSMLIQPYVENAVRHGLQPLASGGLLIVSLSKRGETIVCVVEDNGIGRAQAQAMQEIQDEQRPSLGMSITKERLELLNAGGTKRMSLRITDLFNDEGAPSGTRVEIKIPLEAG